MSLLQIAQYCLHLVVRLMLGVFVGAVMSLPCFVFGLSSFLKPRESQEQFIADCERHPILAKLNPFLRAAKHPSAIQRNRIGGGVMCIAGIFIFIFCVASIVAG